MKKVAHYPEPRVFRGINPARASSAAAPLTAARQWKRAAGTVSVPSQPYGRSPRIAFGDRA